MRGPVVDKLLILALVAGGLVCAHMPPPPVMNGVVMPINFECFIHEHDDGTGECLAYRGGQPTQAQLAAMNVGAVIKLNVPSLLVDGPHDSLPPGVDEYHHPMSPIGPVGHDDTLATLFDLQHAVEVARQTHRPVYLHCSHGCDRTGYVVAVYRVLVEHKPARAAWLEWRRFPRELSDRLALYTDFARETGYVIPDDER